MPVGGSFYLKSYSGDRLRYESDHDPQEELLLEFNSISVSRPRVCDPRLHKEVLHCSTTIRKRAPSGAAAKLTSSLWLHNFSF